MMTQIKTTLVSIQLGNGIGCVNLTINQPQKDERKFKNNYIAQKVREDEIGVHLLV
jgi:hypothetical protein